MSRALDWCFTIQGHSPTDQQVLRVLGADEATQYLVFGREVGSDNGQRHLQGYVRFKNARTFGGVKALLPHGAHIERRSAPQAADAAEYCEKEGDFETFGTKPQRRGAAGGAANQKRYKDAIVLAKAGNFEELCDEFPDIWLRFEHALRRQHKTPRMIQPGTLEHVWLWGEPGTGKSMWGAVKYPNAYMKMANKWWDGWDAADPNHQVVILEDLGLETGRALGDHIKIWADRYSFRGEYKNGSMIITIKKLIVTSNYSLQTFYEQDQDKLHAMQRRFKELELRAGMQITESEADTFVEGTPATAE
ncbi:MAG: putative viral replication protein [Cressdnaviricota sp.]|nr:MAG: putative viral replication protein [Cressdnaviricota sp.]